MKYFIYSSLILLALVLMLMLLAPLPRFSKPCSTVVLASDGQLLGARIAADGQWRFPESDPISDKFKTCLIEFEDQYFYFHPGVNMVAIGRSFVQNVKAKRVVSGGSTITMQVARMARNGAKRTVVNKLVEMLSALKLELFFSKQSILSLYASNAPFGGNMVGIEAACWRYFGHDSSSLSWAQAATLAVLPNAPSLIFPGTNDQKLKVKRDRLLRKLLSRKIIDSLDCELAIEEVLPEKPYALPDHSFHLTERLKKSNSGERITTGIQYQLQQQVVELVREQSQQLASQHIYNASAIVIDVKTNQVRAYIGNSPANHLGAFNNHVDMISSSRSTGSILKPFLYAAMLSDGEMLPNALLPDIPVFLSGYAPRNFDYTFHGAVPASQALSWSLNIPAIYMLRQYGINRFLDKLKQLGFSSFPKNSDHYGLSLILGGGETSLWELGSAYAGLSRTLNSYNAQGQYYKENFEAPSLIPSRQNNQLTPQEGVLSADALWFTFQSLLEVNRPEGHAGWENFQSSRQVAWKTGTSFGFRDAWAIATTPDYVVGVWAGNSNGEGRPGLMGVTSAGPLLFNILNLLPPSAPHRQPDSGITYVQVCSHTGYRLGQNCPESKTAAIPEKGLKSEPCPYCQSVKVIHSQSVNDEDVNVLDEVKVQKWFLLPPAMEFYFKKYNPSYVSAPLASISGKDEQQLIEFIYPGANDQIYIPRSVEGKPGKVVFEVAHREASVKIFWHLDNQYIGTTSYLHQLALSPSSGQHLITLTDENGNTLKRLFTILNSSVK